MLTVKFNKFHVTNGHVKARIMYALDNRADGRKCVTLYGRDYSNNLHKIIPQGYENNSDVMIDYFETGTVRLFEDHPLYADARCRAENNQRIKRDKAIAASTNRPGDQAATMAEETGIDYARCLVMCNMD